MTKKREALTRDQRYWLERIEDCERSGRTLKAYAEERELSVTRLYSWKKRLKAQGILPGRRSSRFQRVRMAEAVPGSDWRVLLPNGVQVTWRGPVDGSSLSLVLEAALRVV